MPEKNELVYSEDTLFRINTEMEFFKSLEYNAEMFLMLRLGCGSYKNVIEEGENELQVIEGAMNVSLEGLTGVA